MVLCVPVWTSAVDLSRAAKDHGPPPSAFARGPSRQVLAPVLRDSFQGGDRHPQPHWDSYFHSRGAEFYKPLELPLHSDSARAASMASCAASPCTRCFAALSAIRSLFTSASAR